MSTQADFGPERDKIGHFRAIFGFFLAFLPRIEQIPEEVAMDLPFERFLEEIGPFSTRIGLNRALFGDFFAKLQASKGLISGQNRFFGHNSLIMPRGALPPLCNLMRNHNLDRKLFVTFLPQTHRYAANREKPSSSAVGETG